MDCPDTKIFGGITLRILSEAPIDRETAQDVSNCVPDSPPGRDPKPVKREDIMNSGPVQRRWSPGAPRLPEMVFTIAGMAGAILAGLTFAPKPAAAASCESLVIDPALIDQNIERGTYRHKLGLSAPQGSRQ